MIDIFQEFFSTMGVLLIGVTVSTLSFFGIEMQDDTKVTTYKSDVLTGSLQVKEHVTHADIKNRNNNNTSSMRDVLNKENKIKKTGEVKNKDILNENILKKEMFVPSTILPDSTISSEKLNNLARKALVNIICTKKTDGLFNPASGSGVIIDSRGVVLTNAHIAQYFLLENYKIKNFMDCILRTGSPAYPTYDAELLYISSSWIKENRNNLIEENPVGTGKNDFALLKITKTIQDGKELPERFDFIEPDMNETNIIKDTPIFVAGYPAGFLGGSTIQKNLWSVTTFSKITELFTFQNGTLDLVSLLGNIAAQKGSSGGGAINMTNGKLLGIIVTSSEAEQTGDRVLNAITIPHINRSIFAEIGVNLENYLSGDLKVRADNFNQTISPSLTELLEAVLEK